MIKTKRDLLPLAAELQPSCHSRLALLEIKVKNLLSRLSALTCAKKNKKNKGGRGVQRVIMCPFSFPF